MSETLWLIERTYAKGKPAEQTEFWLGTTPSLDDSYYANRHVWTTDALQAARFPNENVARTLRLEHFHPEAPVRVCGHMFGCEMSPDPADTVAWLHKDKPTSHVITDRVKSLWLKVDPKQVENYTLPLTEIGAQPKPAEPTPPEQPKERRERQRRARDEFPMLTTYRARMADRRKSAPLATTEQPVAEVVDETQIDFTDSELRTIRPLRPVQIGDLLYAHPQPSSAEPDLNKLVDRFLSWKLPVTVFSDGVPGDPQRTGTNLLSADEALQMFVHVLFNHDVQDVPEGYAASLAPHRNPR